jgi:hypothetical protein
MVAPDTKLLFESLATALMIAFVLPSAAICAELVVTATLLTVLPPVLPPDPGVPMMVLEPPPQAAISAAAVIKAMIDSLRM